ncbi:unnamed protein product [Moneuplotes crassus]|uniref:AP2/ERF domain-containing protein n=1 Tax=Euplotes crassus TaxID=5936 RepID=A0AAD1Y6V0_EUPCR|nr:unnamed protein product [Moneuplotes crassus]
MSWEYTAMLKKLEEAYCVCSHINSTVPRIEDVCICQDWCFCTSSINSKLSTSIGNDSKQDMNGSSCCSKSGTKSKIHKKNITHQLGKEEVEQSENIDDNSQNIKRRKSRSFKLDIKPSLIRVRRKILSSGITAFFSSPKKTRGTADVTLGRRSRYIGVSKNNSHWQAMINSRRDKKYIGTYLTELEAARIYDIYAIAIQGVRAPLNFNYSTAEMLTIIDNFLHPQQ